MKKRQLIRVLASVPFVLIIGIWIVSYSGLLRAQVCSAEHNWNVIAVDGAVYYADVPFSMSMQSTTLEFHRGMTERQVLEYWMEVDVISDAVRDPGVCLPLWFLALLGLGANWFVWRKVRGKSNPRALRALTKKGLLLRILAVVFFLSSVAGWAISLNYNLYIVHWGASYFDELSIENGRVLLFREESGLAKGWEVSHQRRLFFWFEGDDLAYRSADVHFAGFAINWTYDYAPPCQGWFVRIPLWFPTTLSAGLVWLIWRKTRGKYRGQAFPIEEIKSDELKS